MSDFAIGDVVQLKSGGPLMHIAESKNGIATCIWLAGAKLNRETFPEPAIEKTGDAISPGQPSVGAVVHLVDGPEMTVVRLDGNDAYCVYFVGAELMPISLPVACLSEGHRTVVQ